MQLKKSFALLLSAIMMLSCTGVSASAEAATYIANDGIATAYEYADIAESMLYISSNAAECISSCTSSSDIVQITVEQTLQKFWGLWVWNDVDGASWAETERGSSISSVNTKSGLSSGTYRVKSVFTLTSSSGETETITVYSEEKTIS